MDTILVEFKDGDGGLLSWTEATIADWCRQSVNSSKKKYEFWQDCECTSDPELSPGCVCGSQGKDALTRTERVLSTSRREPGLKVTRTGDSEGRNA